MYNALNLGDFFRHTQQTRADMEVGLIHSYGRYLR
jgi:hypothetical protein